MKKFLLFFLVFLLLVGTGSLAFGFWNGKKIRNWATAASEIKNRHNISVQEKDLEERFGRGWSSAEDLKNQSGNFASDLEKTTKEAYGAIQEIGLLSGPSAVQPAKKDLEEYYSQGGNQVKNLKSLVLFMNQLFDVAIIFDKIKENITLEEIQSMITAAKEKSALIAVDNLPDEMKGVGSSLKVETDRFLDTMEQTASGKIESNEQLMANYADFSREESRFFQEAKKYVGLFQDLDPLAKKIEAELTALENVKFNLR